MSNNDSSWRHHAWDDPCASFLTQNSLWFFDYVNWNWFTTSCVWFCDLWLASFPFVWAGLCNGRHFPPWKDSLVFKRVCNHLDFAWLAFSWKNPSHSRIAAPSAACHIMFQATHALSGTSSSPGQSKWDIPGFKCFLKERLIMLLHAECYSIINKGCSYSTWIPAFVPTAHKTKTTNYHCLVINSVTVV